MSDGADTLLDTIRKAIFVVLAGLLILAVVIRPTWTALAGLAPPLDLATLWWRVTRMQHGHSDMGDLDGLAERLRRLVAASSAAALAGILLVTAGGELGGRFGLVIVLISVGLWAVLASRLHTRVTQAEVPGPRLPESMEKSPAVLALIVLLGFFAALGPAPVAGESVRSAWRTALHLESRAPAAQPSALPRSPDPLVINAPQPIVGETPTALPQSPCPDSSEVKALLGRGTTTRVRDGLFQAWYGVGGRVVGCPLGPPIRRGRIWIAELGSGQDAPAAVVFGSGAANVIFSDMYALASEDLVLLAGVDVRLRWGLGTQQLFRYRDGSCRLAQRYGQAVPVLLPAAVTQVLLVIADRTGAVPRVVRDQATRDGRAFKIQMRARDANNVVRGIDSLVVSYIDGRALVQDTGEAGTDAQACPRAAERLTVVSQAVEDAKQAP
jgi:hypothetical protein